MFTYVTGYFGEYTDAAGFQIVRLDLSHVKYQFFDDKNCKKWPLAGSPEDNQGERSKFVVRFGLKGLLM